MAREVSKSDVKTVVPPNLGICHECPYGMCQSPISTIDGKVQLRCSGAQKRVFVPLDVQSHKACKFYKVT